MRRSVGRIEEFEPGTITIREVDGRSIGIFRDGGDFYAILNICPHRGAPVCAGVVAGTMLPSAPGEYVYGLAGRVVRCPWHGWEFDLRTGKSIGPVDPRNLTMLPVGVEDGDVFLLPRGSGDA